VIDTHPVAVRQVIDETPVDRTFVFGVPAGAEAAFAFRPGQFVTVSDPDDPARPPRKKAYSISSSPLEAGRFDVTVRNAGDFGMRFYAFPAGKVLTVIPPRGRFTLDEPVVDDLLLVSGGSGVTPFRGFVRFLRARGHARPVTVVSSARTPEDLVFDAEFRRHAAEAPWFRYVPTVTRLAEGAAFDGRRGRIDEALLRSFVRDPAATTLYACGPDPLVDAALAIGVALKIPDAKRRKEKWG
jgi:3-ketosteroid 9alpha-monooxygenase subunit B